MKRQLIYVILFVAGLLPGLNSMAQQRPSVYEVTKLNLNENAFSDISPIIFENGIIFCSNRRFSNFTDRTSFDGRRLYNIYIAEKKDIATFTRPKLVESDRMEKFNNGPLSVGPDGKTVYFTSETETGRPSRNKKFRNRNGIFIAELSNGRLTAIEPFAYNSINYEVAHPSVSHDGKYLFFSSDMPGGSGKSDIWYCENVNGKWSKPVNMGPVVNSAGAETFPSIHPSGRLYFSSDRPGGMGKLDIYMTTKYNGVWEKPVLLSEPINSNSDDFAFVAEDDLQTGFFSSNRHFDDDIFRFTSTIIRKLSCDELIENSYCYRFFEENAMKFDTIPFLYQWHFGDGGKAEGAVVEHCFEGPGKYIVRLDVVNLITKEIITNEKTDTLVIEDEIQPYITGPDTGVAGKQLQFDALQTNLPGWNIDRYYWNFGDETIAVGEKVDKVFSKPGVYNIQLIVSESPRPGGIVREECVSKNINIVQGP